MVVDIFHKLIPLAAASHIRLVLVNRRGYQGSTPLTDLDTDPLDPAFDFSAADSENMDSSNSRPDRRKLEHYTTYLQARAAEIARFLVKFIENESIPLKIESVGRASGGMALMAWSLGNILPLSLLAFGNTLDPGVMRKLDAYMRKIVIYGMPGLGSHSMYLVWFIFFLRSTLPCFGLPYPTRGLQSVKRFRNSAGTTSTTIYRMGDQLLFTFPDAFGCQDTRFEAFARHSGAKKGQPGEECDHKSFYPDRHLERLGNSNNSTRRSFRYSRGESPYSSKSSLKSPLWGLQ